MPEMTESAGIGIAIPGYDYGTPRAARSPVSLVDLQELERTIGWSEEDAAALQMAAAVLTDQAEQLVDHWRSRIGAQPHLAKWFFGPDGKPDESYKAAVKKRFVRWVIDTCTRPRDRAWLDYQEEIGRRHTPAKKNQTDGAKTPPLVPLRHLIAFSAPLMLDTKDFLAKKGHGAQDVERMQAAWTKSVLLQIALWARPYVSADLW
jgi:Protoglobin